jgi:hypothetical protein
MATAILQLLLGRLVHFVPLLMHCLSFAAAKPEHTLHLPKQPHRTQRMPCSKAHCLLQQQRLGSPVNTHKPLHSKLSAAVWSSFVVAPCGTSFLCPSLAVLGKRPCNRPFLDTAALAAANKPCNCPCLDTQAHGPTHACPFTSAHPHSHVKPGGLNSGTIRFTPSPVKGVARLVALRQLQAAPHTTTMPSQGVTIIRRRSVVTLLGPTP